MDERIVKISRMMTRGTLGGVINTAAAIILLMSTSTEFGSATIKHQTVTNEDGVVTKIAVPFGIRSGWWALKPLLGLSLFTQTAAMVIAATHKEIEAEQQAQSQRQAIAPRRTQRLPASTLSEVRGLDRTVEPEPVAVPTQSTVFPDLTYEVDTKERSPLQHVASSIEGTSAKENKLRRLVEAGTYQDIIKEVAETRKSIALIGIPGTGKTTTSLAINHSRITRFAKDGGAIVASAYKADYYCGTNKIPGAFTQIKMDNGNWIMEDLVELVSMVCQVIEYRNQQPEHIRSQFPPFWLVIGDYSNTPQHIKSSLGKAIHDKFMDQISTIRQHGRSCNVTFIVEIHSSTVANGGVFGDSSQRSSICLFMQGRSTREAGNFSSIKDALRNNSIISVGEKEMILSDWNNRMESIGEMDLRYEVLNDLVSDLVEACTLTGSVMFLSTHLANPVLGVLPYTDNPNYEATDQNLKELFLNLHDMQVDVGGDRSWLHVPGIRLFHGKAIAKAKKLIEHFRPGSTQEKSIPESNVVRMTAPKPPSAYRNQSTTAISADTVMDQELDPPSVVGVHEDGSDDIDSSPFDVDILGKL